MGGLAQGQAVEQCLDKGKGAITPSQQFDVQAQAQHHGVLWLVRVNACDAATLLVGLPERAHRVVRPQYRKARVQAQAQGG
ncbi:hypothetical protein D3C72_2391570 [compost metagenome]